MECRDRSGRPEETPQKSWMRGTLCARVTKLGRVRLECSRRRSDLAKDARVIPNGRKFNFCSSTHPPTRPTSASTSSPPKTYSSRSWCGRASTPPRRLQICSSTNPTARYPTASPTPSPIGAPSTLYQQIDETRRSVLAPSNWRTDPPRAPCPPSRRALEQLLDDVLASLGTRQRPRRVDSIQSRLGEAVTRACPLLVQMLHAYDLVALGVHVTDARRGFELDHAVASLPVSGIPKELVVVALEAVGGVGLVRR